MRSAVTNGKRLFADGDGNTVWARRYRDLVVDQISDLGGEELITAAQASLIRRAATMGVVLEGWEGQLSKGETVDLDLYGRIAGHLRRYHETLGIERVARNVTPSLREYMEAWPVICSSEAAAAHAHTYPSRADEYAKSILFAPHLRGYGVQSRENRPFYRETVQ